MRKDSQEEIDEIAAQVELAAEVQKAEADHDESEHEQELTDEEQQEEKAMQEAAEETHTLHLTKTYRVGNEEIDTIDFSGLEDLTTKDLEFADRVLARMNHAPDDKFTDSLWNRMIAVRATGLPSAFFTELSARDMLAVVGTQRRYFLLGWE